MGSTRRRLRRPFKASLDSPRGGLDALCDPEGDLRVALFCLPQALAEGVALVKVDAGTALLAARGGVKRTDP